MKSRNDDSEWKLNVFENEIVFGKFESSMQCTVSLDGKKKIVKEFGSSSSNWKCSIFFFLAKDFRMINSVGPFEH